MRRKWITSLPLFLPLLLLLLLPSVVVAQQPTPTPSPVTIQPPIATQKADEVSNNDVIRIRANLVSVPVTVFNRRGQVVLDLQQNDFRIYEDGVEQTISHFNDIDNPFSVVLLIDTSGSAAPFLAQIKQAAKAFVEKLAPADTVRPVYFHGEIKSFPKASTKDLPLLNQEIDQMESGPIDLGTRLYDAVDYTLGVLKPEPTRNAIILLTDGENTWGKATMKSTLREAEESDTVVYTLQYGDGPPQKYLQQLAKRTGGRYFKTGDINVIRESFAGIAKELRRQYTIGYYPKESEQRGLERKILVKVNRAHVAVRARKSYAYGR